MSTPPGWYDDGHGAMRWWDGRSWTEQAQPHTRTPDEPLSSIAPTEPYGSVPGPETQQPAKSRGWVLPVVVVGAVVLLLAAGGAVAAIVWNLVASGGPTIVAPSAEPSNQASGAPETSVEPGAPIDLDHPAVTAVQQYDLAYQTSNCELFFRVSSTLMIEEGWNGVYCDEFVSLTEEFNATVQDYVQVVNGAVQNDDGSITVSVEESYVSTLEESLGEEFVDYYDYYVIEEGGAWVVDGITDTAGTQ